MQRMSNMNPTLPRSPLRPQERMRGALSCYILYHANGNIINPIFHNLT